MFITRYNSDEEFRNKIQNDYFINPFKLSIWEIYALEEILRVGNKNLFDELETLSKINEENVSLEDINNFIKLFSQDERFRNFKLEQFNENPNTLSNSEKTILDIYFKKTILDIYKEARENPKETHDKMCDEMFNYAPLNPILFNTDKEIKMTLINLFVGKFIFELLEKPELRPIKVRQRERGLIADIDKSTLIEYIYPLIIQDYSKVEQVVNNWFVRVKFNVLLGKGEEAFSEYLKYNTNISIDEILEHGKNKKRK